METPVSDPIKCGPSLSLSAKGAIIIFLYSTAATRATTFSRLFALGACAIRREVWPSPSSWRAAIWEWSAGVIRWPLSIRSDSSSGSPVSVLTKNYFRRTLWRFCHSFCVVSLFLSLTPRTTTVALRKCQWIVHKAVQFLPSVRFLISN